MEKTKLRPGRGDGRTLWGWEKRTGIATGLAFRAGRGLAKMRGLVGFGRFQVPEGQLCASGSDPVQIDSGGHCHSSIGNLLTLV